MVRLLNEKLNWKLRTSNYVEYFFETEKMY